MESTPPAKSQPLHNFDLPNLKWNRDGNASSSSSSLHRRRPIKSPSGRPDASSSSPTRRDSVSAPPPPRLRSPSLPSRESPPGGDSAMKQSPVRGESFKPSPICKSFLVGGDRERLSFELERAGRLFRSGQSSTGAEALKKSKGAPFECRGVNSSKNFPSGTEKSKDKSEKKKPKEPEDDNNSKKFASAGGLGICSSGKEKTEKKKLPKEIEEVDVAGFNITKILIKMPGKNGKPVEENKPEEPPQIPHKGEHGRKGVIQTEDETRTWELRPRKPKLKTQNANAPANTVKTAKDEKSGGKELKRGDGDGGGEKEKEKKEKKEKRKLSICIPLSKAEIEEDIYALSGSKPARRPKKRAKNIQKNLDAVFPGLWLVSITPESYKVSENSLKG